LDAEFGKKKDEMIVLSIITPRKNSSYSRCEASAPDNEAIKAGDKQFIKRKL